MEHIDNVKSLCTLLVLAVNDKDKDATRSLLEDLNFYLTENGLVSE